MTRDTAIKLIELELIKRSSGHYSYDAKAHANDILTLLETIGLISPVHTEIVTFRDIDCVPYDEVVEVPGWRKG